MTKKSKHKPSVREHEQLPLQEAVDHHRAGRLEEARRLYRSILRKQPDHPDVNHNLGFIQIQMKQPAKAVPYFKAALEANPKQGQYWLSYIDALIQADQIDVARNVLEQGRQQGLRGEAADALTWRLGDPSPDEISTLAALFKQGRYTEAETLARQLTERFPQNGIGWKALGVAFMRQGRNDEALEAMRKAVELLPRDAEAHSNLSVILLKMIPQWHVLMLNNTLRNNAYFEALQACITPDSNVLEIGTGSGLLSMMAARLGAKQVVTCEAVPLIAATAQEIIADNNLDSEIRVIAKKSTDLRVGEDLPQRANLLVSEIFSSELLSEGALASFEDAKRRLLTPDARIIPASGSVVFALLGGEELDKKIRVDEVHGFDLSRFNTIVSQKLNLQLTDIDVHFLTDDTEAFLFDFAKSDYSPSETKTLRVPITTTGRCHGVIQWIRLRMNDDIVFENRPSIQSAASEWPPLIYRFPKPMNVVSGQTAVISVAHNREVVWFFLDSLED